MLNSPTGTEQDEDDAVEREVAKGARGAVALAGVATLIVVGLWFAFYLLVFVPRAQVP